MGKLNSKDYIYLTMLKLLIVAATSLAYTLSIANISDAKMKPLAKKIDPQQSCLEQTAHPSQFYDISTSDIRDICQAIDAYYIMLNAIPQAFDKLCETGSCNVGKTVGFEVKGMRLKSYLKDRATIHTQIICREYNWSKDKNKWVYSNQSIVVEMIDFEKKNGKWFLTKKYFNGYK